jgi:hypothetical protein
MTTVLPACVKRGRGRPTNKERGIPNKITPRKKEVYIKGKVGRPAGTGKAPTVRPDSQHIQNGVWATYITYSPYKTKKGGTVFHKHTKIVKTTNRDQKREHTERKCEEVKKAKKVLSVSNIHHLNIEQLTAINLILYPITA